MAASFGTLTPLLDPRSVAVIGASDREGNLGGLCVSYYRKFGFAGEVWPVNAGRDQVGGYRCYPSLADLPAVPDLAVIAVPADKVHGVVADCIAAKVPGAVVWAGGFAEGDAAGRQRQLELETLVKGSGLRLCGPNCIGIINTATGMTASFSSLLQELDHFNSGSVSMVSQSGGISVMSHGRAQELGLGFRLTISCGNEAILAIPEFISALVEDEGTKVIAVYTEGLSSPDAFAAALGKAREARKPVVILKGGATEESGRAALAHTGRLAGLDRTYDAIFREFAAIRVQSAEELLDVSLQIASMPLGRWPKSNRVLLSSFGGGSGVVGTDQCIREGMVVPQLGPEVRARANALLTPLASTLNPIDLTPGSVTNEKNRADLPDAMRELIKAPEADSIVFLSGGFAHLAPVVADLYEMIAREGEKPAVISWSSPPDGIVSGFAKKGVRVFDENARAIRTMGNLVRYGENLRHRIRQRPELVRQLDWARFVPHGQGPQVVSENTVAAILEAAGLPVAKGRLAVSPADVASAIAEVGFPVVMKGISPEVTHRAAAGLLALDISDIETAARTDRLFRERAAKLGVALDGIWIQHMAKGHAELLITAFRDAEFGVIVGVGIGGGMTEVIDDVVFSRAPIDAEGAADLIARLRTVKRLPNHLGDSQHALAADFLARFSALAASAPWKRFTLEVNPLKLSSTAGLAVDGLLLIEEI